MKLSLKTALYLSLAPFILTSCLLQEPKSKPESVTEANDYEKVLDDVVGQGSIVPNAVTLGQKDTRVETISISNSVVTELIRRSLEVTESSYDQAQQKRTLRFKVDYVVRNSKGEVEDQNSVERKTEISVTPEGYYQFHDTGNDKTIHSWDFIIGLRGFCDSFETEQYYVDIKCSNLTLQAGNWGTKYIEAVPVRILSLIRSVVLTEKSTGQVQSSKLRYTIQIAAGLQEISKVVSYCSEGLQKFENQIYYLVRCNNLESL